MQHILRLQAGGPGVDNLDAIIAASDGVMVARGDLDAIRIGSRKGLQVTEASIVRYLERVGGRRD